MRTTCSSSGFIPAGRLPSWARFRAQHRETPTHRALAAQPCQPPCPLCHRYKTRLCSFGRNCNRSICFFAHSAEELRNVPVAEDSLRELDDRDFLMQLMRAQDNGMLPPAALQIPNGPADLNLALQQALQQSPMGPPGRGSYSGVPDPMSGRPSYNGGMLSPTHDLLSASHRASYSGIPDPATAYAARASMSGFGGPDASALLLHHHHQQQQQHAAAVAAARASFNGFADPTAGLLASAGLLPSQQARDAAAALAGLPGSARPSLSGLPGMGDAATDMMLQSMGAMRGNGAAAMANAMSMNRALSQELGMVQVGPGGCRGCAWAHVGAAMWVFQPVLRLTGKATLQDASAGKGS
jgi:transcription elongation factor SPT5